MGHTFLAHPDTPRAATATPGFTALPCRIHTHARYTTCPRRPTALRGIPPTFLPRVTRDTVAVCPAPRTTNAHPSTHGHARLWATRPTPARFLLHTLCRITHPTTLPFAIWIRCRHGHAFAPAVSRLLPRTLPLHRYRVRNLAHHLRLLRFYACLHRYAMPLLNAFRASAPRYMPYPTTRRCAMPTPAFLPYARDHGLGGLLRLPTHAAAGGFFAHMHTDPTTPPLLAFAAARAAYPALPAGSAFRAPPRITTRLYLVAVHLAYPPHTLPPPDPTRPALHTHTRCTHAFTVWLGPVPLPTGPPHISTHRALSFADTPHPTRSRAHQTYHGGTPANSFCRANRAVKRALHCQAGAPTPWTTPPPWRESRRRGRGFYRNNPEPIQTAPHTRRHCYYEHLNILPERDTAFKKRHCGHRLHERAIFSLPVLHGIAVILWATYHLALRVLRDGHSPLSAASTQTKRFRYSHLPRRREQRTRLDEPMSRELAIARIPTTWQRPPPHAPTKAGPSPGGTGCLFSLSVCRTHLTDAFWRGRA